MSSQWRDLLDGADLVRRRVGQAKVRTYNSPFPRPSSSNINCDINETIPDSWWKTELDQWLVRKVKVPVKGLLHRAAMCHLPTGRKSVLPIFFWIAYAVLEKVLYVLWGSPTQDHIGGGELLGAAWVVVRAIVLSSNWDWAERKNQQGFPDILNRVHILRSVSWRGTAGSRT